jgi:hypothetical protein
MYLGASLVLFKGRFSDEEKTPSCTWGIEFKISEYICALELSQFKFAARIQCFKFVDSKETWHSQFF